MWDELLPCPKVTQENLTPTISVRAVAKLIPAGRAPAALATESISVYGFQSHLIRSCILHKYYTFSPLHPENQIPESSHSSCRVVYWLCFKQPGTFSRTSVLLQFRLRRAAVICQANAGKAHHWGVSALFKYRIKQDQLWPIHSTTGFC